MELLCSSLLEMNVVLVAAEGDYARSFQKEKHREKLVADMIRAGMAEMWPLCNV